LYARRRTPTATVAVCAAASDSVAERSAPLDANAWASTGALEREHLVVGRPRGRAPSALARAPADGAAVDRPRSSRPRSGHRPGDRGARAAGGHQRPPGPAGALAAARGQVGAGPQHRRGLGAGAILDPADVGVVLDAGLGLAAPGLGDRAARDARDRHHRRRQAKDHRRSSRARASIAARRLRKRLEARRHRGLGLARRRGPGRQGPFEPSDSPQHVDGAGVDRPPPARPRARGRWARRRRRSGRRSRRGADALSPIVAASEPPPRTAIAVDAASSSVARHRLGALVLAAQLGGIAVEPVGRARPSRATSAVERRLGVAQRCGLIVELLGVGQRVERVVGQDDLLGRRRRPTA
jgi:hypothetical protein